MTLTTINHTISVLHNMMNDNWDLWETTTQAKRKVYDLQMEYQHNDDFPILANAARMEATRLDLAIISIQANREKLSKELKSVHQMQSAALLAIVNENKDTREFLATL